jgi:hypothetical protein
MSIVACVGADGPAPILRGVQAAAPAPLQSAEELAAIAEQLQ